jgi:glycine/D-amino acid oxidase-like deaminating enzyme
MLNMPDHGENGTGAAFPHHSFWSENFGPYTPSPPLRGDLKVDVVIIGGGFTGLSAAINIKQLDAAARVVVVEQEAIGFGASGRNSGWVWPNLSTYDRVLAAHGRETLRETYQYARRAYEYVGDLVNTHGLDSDYRETGLLRPSVSAAYERDRLDYAEFCEMLGRSDQISEMSESEVQATVSSPLFHKALWDKELALIQPVKHARALAKLARSLGVMVCEQTPAVSFVENSNGVTVHTPTGKITADRLVIATNGYTHLLRGPHANALKRHQRPVFAYNTISRPLTEAEWESVGWSSRCAIYSFGPASHFGNPTADGRIHWCSDRFIGIPNGDDMSMEYVPNYNATLKSQTPLFFPGLSDLELTHHWGGPVGVTMDSIFHLGALPGSERIYLSVGCNGNGVSLTHLNGRIVAELVTGRQSELCDLWFVNRKPRLWPSKFFAVAAMRFVIGREMKSAKRRGIKAGLEALVTESQEGLSE